MNLRANVHWLKHLTSPAGMKEYRAVEFNVKIPSLTKKNTQEFTDLWVHLEACHLYAAFLQW